MGLLRRATLLLAVGLPACERDPVELRLNEAYVAVHGVLRAGEPVAAILITRNLPRGRVEPVTGATARLISGSATLTLEPAHADACAAVDPVLQSGCYGAELDGLAPGERYALVIDGPEGLHVEGTAEVPPAPAILAPMPWSQIALTCENGPRCEAVGPGPAGVGSFPLEASGGPEAGRLEVAIAIDTTFAAGKRAAGACFARLDGPTVLDPAATAPVMIRVRRIICPADWDSARARVFVTGFDSVYARYAEALEDREGVRGRAIAAGLAGAFGVFAGAATAAVRVTILRQPL